MVSFSNLTDMVAVVIGGHAATSGNIDRDMEFVHIGLVSHVLCAGGLEEIVRDYR